MLSNKQKSKTQNTKLNIQIRATLSRNVFGENIVDEAASGVKTTRGTVHNGISSK